ncbi:nucleoside triphosphate pyrophosphohydrolase [Streptomyces sp. NPDC046374]|uniref:nucleoside triphosphate pyrophosphohydrolase n=1 Tax=Streptomyces sp. NPDC046374 TaxID=3154917 RepID=UPI0033C7ABAE
MERYSKVGKLVRDGIPQIIRAKGAVPVTYTAGPEEYRSRLRDKLHEEVNEFLDADHAAAPEELADVLEVVHALAADLGIGTEQLEKIREAKAGERGGFADRIVWTGNR